ncbi:hypothetical protein RHSIM_Rhsim02G0148000 [Rhododendron simsii]|uniref:Uncharacterized protein n=1 Tax=Rhododendron simsii TaxID=118357 RepID=A0A834LXZ1_RHOSS|nr:hypothetical protein RHSIM_Rhsim02G0148000 [Rhododendron simsii]
MLKLLLTCIVAAYYACCCCFADATAIFPMVYQDAFLWCSSGLLAYSRPCFHEHPAVVCVQQQSVSFQLNAWLDNIVYHSFAHYNNEDAASPATAQALLRALFSKRAQLKCLFETNLLTIGPQFGEDIDDATRYINNAYDKGLSPYEFLQNMKKKGILMPEIGHKYIASSLNYYYPPIAPL